MFIHIFYKYLDLSYMPKEMQCFILSYISDLLSLINRVINLTREVFYITSQTSLSLEIFFITIIYIFSYS